MRYKLNFVGKWQKKYVVGEKHPTNIKIIYCIHRIIKYVLFTTFTETREPTDVPEIAVASKNTNGIDCWHTTQTTTAEESSWIGSSSHHAVCANASVPSMNTVRVLISTVSYKKENSIGQQLYFWITPSIWA